MGMRKVMSEDSARRAFHHATPEHTREWLQKHLCQTYEPLLEHVRVMDLDSTVKPLYGKQEQAVKGYNPAKPGRPSHVIHTYLIANLRLVLGAEVQAGNQTASSYAQPSFWSCFDTLPRESQPVFIRGDAGWANERMSKKPTSETRRICSRVRKADRSRNCWPAASRSTNGNLRVKAGKAPGARCDSPVGRVNAK